MERGSRYGPPVERKANGTLYEMTPDQLRQAAKIIQKYCCNYDRGNCLLLEDKDERVCPQRISYAVGCRWFRNALLPVFPKLEAEIFKDIALRRCVMCGSRFVPHSNRSKYCPVCAAAVRRASDRERKRKKRHIVRI